MEAAVSFPSKDWKQRCDWCRKRGYKEIFQTTYVQRNPCRVIREITDADRPYYFKDRKFDEEAWTKINAK